MRLLRLVRLLRLLRVLRLLACLPLPYRLLSSHLPPMVVRCSSRRRQNSPQESDAKIRSDYQIIIIFDVPFRCIFPCVQILRLENYIFKRYSAVMPATLALLISKYQSTAFTNNLHRLLGVLLGKAGGFLGVFGGSVDPI